MSEIVKLEKTDAEGGKMDICPFLGISPPYDFSETYRESSPSILDQIPTIRTLPPEDLKLSKFDKVKNLTLRGEKWTFAYF